MEADELKLVLKVTLDLADERTPLTKTDRGINMACLRSEIT